MARTWLRDALPQVFAAGATDGPLAALTAAADEMHQPVSDVLDHLETRFDPARAPDPMVCYLASWVDLDWLTLPESPTRSRSTLPGGAAPLRDLLAASADLASTGGTAAGIIRFLELATRRTGYTVTDVGGFHITVGLPPGAGDLAEVVTRIVATTKPAHVTAEILPAPAEVSAPAAEPTPDPAAPPPAPAVPPPAPGTATPPATASVAPRRAAPEVNPGDPR